MQKVWSVSVCVCLRGGAERYRARERESERV